jgi:hypothetical protein
MMEMRDSGHYTLAEMLQLPGYLDGSSLGNLADNRGLPFRIYATARMRRKAELCAWPGARRSRKNRPRGLAAKAAKAAKIKGALLDLGLLLAFGLVDGAVAQQQPNPLGSYYQVPQVNIVPQTPATQVPKFNKIAPLSTEPVPMYPQYDQPKSRSQQRIER